MMWIHNLNPVLLEIFGLQVRYYGLAYVIGFLIGMWWLMIYRREIGWSKDQVYDFSFYVILGVIIGSRLFQVLFWEPVYYFSNPLKIFYLWEGGMAFHGGLVATILVAWWYARRTEVNFWKLADIMSVPAVFALALGRIANFINGELVGRVTNVSWCVDFGDGECRHPYTLYVAAKRFVVFGILAWLYKKKLKEGLVFWSMITLLGLGRLGLDFYREDILYWGLSVGQWMSLTMFIVGLIVILKYYRKSLRKVFK